MALYTKIPLDAIISSGGFMIPKRIDLGSIVYDVELVEKLLDSDGGTKLSGQISANRAIIRVEANNHAQMQILTIIHEMVHHILRTCGQEHAVDPERIEDVIEALSGGILSSLRNNPDLMKAVEELDA
jgi:hypothetical protein